MSEKLDPKGKGSVLSGLLRNQIFIPFAALILLALFNLIADPTFFAVALKQNSAGSYILSGNLISIIDNMFVLIFLRELLINTFNDSIFSH